MVVAFIVGALIGIMLFCLGLGVWAILNLDKFTIH